MSATLTPLPSPNAGPADAPANTPKWNVLPFPSMESSESPQPGPKPLPAWPGDNPASSGPSGAPFPKSWPSPLSAMPSAARAVPTPSTPEFAVSPSGPVEAAADASPVSIPAAPPPAVAEEATPDFTDDDLRQAFGPIVEQAVRNTVYARENGIDTHLEPMLRATIRRALAEYAPAARPFQPPGALDRFVWHVQALFTSRTYEDIFFEKTRRFQVEEVFLLDRSTLALVSFASCDPARHASARRVNGTVQRLALQLRDEQGEIRKSFDLSDRRSVIAREGRHVVLMSLVRGMPGELVNADLEFALRRIEDHFRDRFEQQGSELLLTIQPFLEDCLLIQAPASAA